jgi:alpha-1,2-mannosyltransferase
MRAAVGGPATPAGVAGRFRVARDRDLGPLPHPGGVGVLDRCPTSVSPAPDRRGLLWIGAIILTSAAVLIAAGHGLDAMHDQYDLRIYFGAIGWWERGNDLYGYGVADPVMGLLGFTYPPFAAVLMAPMGTLGWPGVQGLTLVGILAAGAVVVHLCLGERFRVPVGHAWPVLAAATGAAFLLQPFRQTLGMGQINLFLAALVLADILVLGRKGGRWAGVGIGLAMAIKIVPGVFLIYLAVARQWRAMGVAAITCAVCWLVGAVVAPAATWEYFTSLLWNTGRVGVPASPSNQSLYGLLARIAAPGQPSLAALAVVALPVGALAVRRMARAVAAGDTLAAVTIAGLLGVLLCPVSWIHHCVWVLPALVVIAHRATLAVREWVEDGRFDLARLAPPAGLLLSGLLVLVPDTRALFNLPFANVVALSPLQILTSSLPMLWMLTAMLALPILSGTPRRSRGTVNSDIPEGLRQG